jgi:nitroimidazol reductase NimA-like FMN-containing flavoprotein (pyridoxamine 5'-phosphate oxidase superfamily)
MSETPPSERTRVKRLPERGAYDRETVYSILDEGLVCHVGIAVEGQPFVIPMAYARMGDTLLLHGSGGSRVMRALQAGAEVCVAVTHLDGLVLARSAFHHSMNYRSVVIFGKARAIDGDQAKLAAFRAFFEHVLPGRWEDVRPPDPKELAQTLLVELPLDEASAKIRTGPPADEADDYGLPVWAGVVPFEVSPQPPVADPALAEGIDTPDYLPAQSRNRKSRR